MSHPKLPPDAEASEPLQNDEVLNLEETAALLRISRPTLLELAHRREIPARQAGKVWRFHRPTVLGWLAGNDRISRSKRKL